ncbi:dynamin family protein [Effusibacillus dendaii]|uniref:GTPase n=1 Tax=Effusibacillus dendaii TaxID=2743772 RepID=A0A7I8DGW2_9BACL|nr:dynamin family protein [Effusibacillus dendaii]BCJ87041.1 GTPase [Effusibacillus dendaii]
MQTTDLSKLENAFQQAGDERSARKLRQLIDKLEHGTFVIAFCGHFSAGKSSMINRLVGSQVLPSSPIPTSANVVTIENGASRVDVTGRDGSVFTMPVSDLERLQEYAIDGEAIETIRIQHPTDFLPEGVQVMDTPGIDSTDDAHKVATESALHLADIVLYVMDYNHVQSEVNFGFTKTLKDRGKAVWLVVNQIDKHNEFELPFAEYQQSVKDSFAAWGIEPDGIFYTSLKENDHPQNQFALLQGGIGNLLDNRDILMKYSVMQSAIHVIDEHLELYTARHNGERNRLIEILDNMEEYQPGDTAVLTVSLRQKAARLQEEIRQSQGTAEQLKEEMERDLYSLIENAILIPFQTTELCGRYIESRRPGFRVGFLFSGGKTEQERERRLKELYDDFTGKVNANLDWHFKDLLVKVPERFGIRDESYANSVYALKIELTPDMLAGWVKEGALASQEYMYQYAKDISAEVKSMYRRTVADFVRKAVSLAEQESSNDGQVQQAELAEVNRYLQAAEGLERLQQQEQAYRNELIGMLGGEQTDGWQQVAELYAAEELVTVGIVEEKAAAAGTSETVVPPAVAGVQELRPGHAAMDNPSVPGIVESEQNRQTFKAALVHMADKLKTVVEMVQPIPGFHTMAGQLTERADRLRQNLFTVALFGAFSAGKSSFANAMIGELLLPVSPNPTTATINKILPPTAEWPHGHVRVKLKSVADMVTDLKASLQIFGRQADQAEPDGFFVEVERISAELDPEAVPPNAKPHFSFLKAFAKGIANVKDRLGQELRVDLVEFKQYVAQEEKACFVEWIELYFDCELTRQGIMLIDTPGADSINARHTRVAFDTIKNADAVLFVTYYNHAFSNADREFLIQLGRVKDTFEMDKMFFLVNAADLADDEEELAGVVAHVRKNLLSCGISQPRIYSVSSQMALLARLQEKGLLPSTADRVYRKLTKTAESEPLPSTADAVGLSGIAQFERDFITFTIEELTEVAIQSAQAEIRRALSSLQELIETAMADESVRNEKRTLLERSLQTAKQAVAAVESDSEQRSIEKETDELIYYVKQRMFLRFSEAFNESFSSSVLRDDAGNIKKILISCMDELIRFLAFNAGQEMRATALRVERQVNHAAGRMFEKMDEAVRIHLPGCQLNPYEKLSWPVPEFEEELPGATVERFAGALSLYKNAKDFFERNSKVKMRDELEKLMQEPVDRYLSAATDLLKQTYGERFVQVVERLKQAVQNEADEYANGLFAALSMKLDMAALRQTEHRIAKLQVSHSQID